MFTVGQRKRLPLPGGSGRPVYVTEINASTGVVTVGHAEDLMKRELFASGVNWVSGVPPTRPVEADVRIRYNGRDATARVTPVGDWAKIEFDEPVRAITPGQAVVFYRGDEVLGGGIIELSAPVSNSLPAAVAAS